MNMIYDKLNQFITKLESKYSSFSIYQILRWIAGFQLLSFFLNLYSPTFINWINFDVENIFLGQVWRIITWIFLPLSYNPLFAIISMFFLFFISDGLEEHWGSFRYNLYIIFSIIWLALISFIPFLLGFSPSISNSISYSISLLFYQMVFFAFASIYPNQTVLLFFIIPVKMKWLAIISIFLLFAGFVVSSPAPIIFTIFLIVYLLPFIIIFAPNFVKYLNQKKRLSSYKNYVKEEENTPFHECGKCNITDISNPNMTFKVTKDDIEMCEDCLKTRNL